MLDTGPLSLVASLPRTTLVQQLHRWAEQHATVGNRLLVPAIADFEVRRELVRLQRHQSVQALDAFETAEPYRYLPLTDSALRLAASLWAEARQRGMPTADPRELDCDVIIAAQALTLQVQPGTLVIATSNVGHPSQFVNAALWTEIRP